MDIPNLIPSNVGFRQIINGLPADLYTIYSNDKSCVCAITSYGARLVSLLVPDLEGKPTDVILGYPDLDGYLQQPEDYCGAVVGRCANRIAAGLFVLDGYTYALPINNGHNTLHGGFLGLHGRLWQLVSSSDSAITLKYISEDGEEGFPGTLTITVTYEWTNASTLTISYRAATEKTTLVNLSNHSYFNLSGEGAETVLDHDLEIVASKITPVDSTMIPTGQLLPVTGTPFDFTSPTPIGKRIDDPHQQLKIGDGYDHNYVLDGTPGRDAVVVQSPVTGIRMRINTDRPGMQLYSGNFLDGSRTGKSGKPYRYRSAIALEPQGFPDAIHHPGFPSVVLKPGAEYHSVNTYAFDVKKPTSQV